MKGMNTVLVGAVVLNQATIKEAVAQYLNDHVLKAPVRVLAVMPHDAGMPGPPMFEVKVEMVEDEPESKQG